MGLGQESDREGEVVSWEAALSAPGRVAMNCQKAPFAAIAQNPGREGLHPCVWCMRAVGRDISRSVAPILTSGKPSQSLGTGSPATGSALEPYTGASRAGASLKTRDKCGLGQLRVATDGPRPGERQRRRGGELVIHRKRPGARNRASRRRGAPTGYLDLPSSSLFLPFPFPSLPGLRPATAAPCFFRERDFPFMLPL